jgi:ABC-type sugar transport system substrate-binding protein
MKKIIIASIIIMMVSTYSFAGGGQEKADDSKPIYRILYIQPSAEAYSQMEVDASKLVVEYINENETEFGAEFDNVNSEAKPEKELANVEDGISLNYDAIIDFTVASETAQRAAQLCNEAGIPYFVLGQAAPGPGEVTATIGLNFKQVGGLAGEYVAEHFPNAKIAIVQGMLGQGISEPIEAGFEEKLGPNNEVVLRAPGNWDADTTRAVVTDWMTTWEPGDFDMIFAMNADMYLGTVGVLEDSGRLNDPIRIITHNGRPEDFQGVMEGKAVATLSNSPTYEAGMLMKAVITHLRGGDVPKRIFSPAVMVDKTNPEDNLGWGLESGVKAYKEVEF